MSSAVLRACDAVSGGAVLAAVVLGPWALGAFMPWTVVALEVVAFIGLLAAVLGAALRRWLQEGPPSTWLRLARPGWVWVVAGILTLYVAVSVLNARAVSRKATYGIEFDYREVVGWLPHSYDRWRTLEALHQWLAAAGLAWVFMAWVRSGSPGDRDAAAWGRLPRRLRILVWTLAVSSGALAVAGLAQKLSGTEWIFGLLEWMLLGKKWGNSSGGFATFPYQANAAQYFNLVWPLVLGTWWVEWRAEWARRGVRPRIGTNPLDILPALGIPALACAYAAGSRGGMLVATLQVLVLIPVLLRRRHGPSHLRLVVFVSMLLALGLAAWAGWSRGWDRFANILTDDGSGRLHTWGVVRGMIPDFDPWGSGLGSFSSVVQPYWPDPFGDWQAFVHNDWLEFRLELGWIGSILLGLLVLAWVVRWVRGPWLPVSRDFSAFVGVAMLGVLLHAAVDYPLHVYSLVLVVVLMGSLLVWLPPFWADRRRNGGRQAAPDVTDTPDGRP